MLPYKKIVFQNGLRLLLVPQEGAKTITVLVLVEAGSKYETKELNGLSHFLEHMCFKGTKKRPKSLDISSEFDQIGAEYNAFTAQEMTGYFAKAQAKHLESISDLISDLYLNPVFDLQEIDRERGVIIEEINMYEDLPQRRVQELFISLLYKDQPAGWDIAGRKEVIGKLNRDDFLKYRSDHYVASATLVVVAGAFDESEIVKIIEDRFAGIATDFKKTKLAIKEHQKKPEILSKPKKTDQTHLVLGVRAYNIFDERRTTLRVLADILGGGMSSRLFQKIRGEMGAAYYIDASSELFTDHGFLAISAGIDHKKIEAVVTSIIEELERIKKEKVSDKELNRVKDHLIGGLILNIETSDELASFYGGQEIITKKILTPEEIFKEINQVDQKDIITIANDIFINEKLNLAVIGPDDFSLRLQPLLNFRT